jgi:plasmid stability protein
MEVKAMATLTVRDVDDETATKLRQRAERHRRSLEAELRLILREAAERPSAEELLAWADRIAAMTPDVPQTDSAVLLREMREGR